LCSDRYKIDNIEINPKEPSLVFPKQLSAQRARRIFARAARGVIVTFDQCTPPLLVYRDQLAEFHAPLRRAYVAVAFATAFVCPDRAVSCVTPELLRMPESAYVKFASPPHQAANTNSNCRRCGHPVDWHANSDVRYCVVAGCGCFHFIPQTRTNVTATTASETSPTGHQHK
jgi:hypothetical protein